MSLRHDAVWQYRHVLSETMILWNLSIRVRRYSACDQQSFEAALGDETIQLTSVSAAATCKQRISIRHVPPSRFDVVHRWS